VISLSDISYRYPGHEQAWNLEGITLTIEDGEFVLICGSSGSGKSTLAYLLNGLIPHFFGGILKGVVCVDGMDTREMSVARLLPHVGMVLQNTDAHLFSSTVEEEIAFGLENLGMPQAEIGIRIRRIAELLQIQDLLHRPPPALSGGERRLAAIGSVLCLNPSLLVLDEPFGHLDWEGMRRVRRVLARLHKMGKTIVVIEHRVSGLLHLASRCLIVDKGKIISDTPSSQAPALLQEAHLVPQYPENPKRDPQSETESISIQDLTHEREGRKILKEISLQVRQGEAVAIVGRNGSGKTTLIRHLNGLRQPKAGRVSVMGSVLRGKGPLETASLVGIAFQNPNDQFFKNRVREELAAGVKISGKGEDGVWEICDLFHLRALMDRSPYRLSEGEKRRVAIASITAMNPGILVIDEPTVGQDGRFMEALAALVTSLRDRGHTVVIVTHDLEFALAVSDRWIVLHEGRKVGDGKPEDLLRDDKLIKIGAIAPEGERYYPSRPPLTHGN
jgi:energy-coupling factor transport system ATP-binding protein